MTIYPFTMAKSLSENLSPGLEAYRSSPSEEFALESLPALPSSPTVSSDESDLPYFHRTSIQSVSTLCSEKDYETEQLLKDPDDSPTIVIRFPWYTRLKSFYTLRPIKFVVDGVWRLILVIIPSFLRPGPKRKLYPTSYLDGLRGVAAFFVVQDHLLRDWFPIITHGYKSSAGANLFIQLPIIRCLYSGSGMVTLFFIISGFALSYKALRQMRNRQFAPVLETLASSIFRRGTRLYLPITVSTLISMLFRVVHLYPVNPWPPLTLPVAAPTFRAQLYDWFLNWLVLINPFQPTNVGNPYPPPYDSHLWSKFVKAYLPTCFGPGSGALLHIFWLFASIPIEFRGSIVVFVIVLALSKANQTPRLLIMGIFEFYVLWIGRWDMGLFLGGMLLAEVQFLRRDLFPEPSLALNDSTIPSQSGGKRFLKHLQKYLQHLLTICLFFMGLFLISFPDIHSESTPGYIQLHSWTPEPYRTFYLIQKFWDTIGALIVLTAISFSPPIGYAHDSTPLLQIPFNTRLAQYLGDISFSLYMLHGPFIYGVGWAMLVAAKGAPETYWWAFAKYVAVVMSLSIWGADIFWRLVDSQSTVFGKWIASKCFVKE